jgi:hypothetical protein
MNNAERIAELRAEADRLEALDKQGDLWLADSNGEVYAISDLPAHLQKTFDEQGRRFTTKHKAELFSAWERAVTKVNKAILAGDCGEYAPYFFSGKFEWSARFGVENLFAQSTESHVNEVIKMHPNEFAAIRKYQLERDKR